MTPLPLLAIPGLTLIFLGWSDAPGLTSEPALRIPAGGAAKPPVRDFAHIRPSGGHLEHDPPLTDVPQQEDDTR
jgi:hypothetical protein